MESNTWGESNTYRDPSQQQTDTKAVEKLSSMNVAYVILYLAYYQCGKVIIFKNKRLKIMGTNKKNICIIDLKEKKNEIKRVVTHRKDYTAGDKEPLFQKNFNVYFVFNGKISR